MRIASCLKCMSVSPLTDFSGSNPDHDVVLQDWIRRHLHGVAPDRIPGPEHPGAAPIVQVDMPELIHNKRWLKMPPEVQEEAIQRMEYTALEDIKNRLNSTIGGSLEEEFTVRDDLKEDAGKCFLRHGSPTYPASGCIDYRDDSKLLSSRHVPSDQRKYLCHFCPYHTTVTVERRRKAGQYR